MVPSMPGAAGVVGLERFRVACGAERGLGLGDCAGLEGDRAPLAFGHSSLTGQDSQSERAMMATIASLQCCEHGAAVTRTSSPARRSPAARRTRQGSHAGACWRSMPTTSLVGGLDDEGTLAW
jgi:hypothetical protein